MKRALYALLLTFLASQTFAVAQSSHKIFDGEIADSQCGMNVHSTNRTHDEMIKTGLMGNTPEECVQNCIKRGGRYVFVSTDHKIAYKLDPQDAVKSFAGQKVRIQGELSHGVLFVATIKPV